MSNLIYNGNWLLTLSNLPTVDMGSHIGPFSGNGKIGMYVSMSNIGTQKTQLSGNLSFNQIGKYRNNTINGFNMNEIKFISNTSSNISYDFVHQMLDMSDGSIETKFTISSNNTNMINATHTITPLRQYPYCVLQTVSITPLTNIESLDVFHEVNGDTNFINDMEFNNNVIYNERIYDDKGLYILNATGNINKLNYHGKSTKLVGATCYFLEDNNARNLGFNVFNDLKSCYQKHRYYNMNMGETTTFHMLSAQMTSLDFEEPLEEVKRMLLNIAFKYDNIPSLISHIRNENRAAWDKLWLSDILLEPKNGITVEEAYQVNVIKQLIRFNLFNIYSCLRDGINTEINPLNLSYLDGNGNIFFDGDLWLVPVLLFLKPNIAKTLLESRHKNIEQATQLAASFGYKGSKFPYQNDVLGYQTMYWDVISPLHIFNNALVAINVWNYYRVTLDKEWLSTKGYVMMRNVADFVSSFVTIDGSDNYNMNNTAGMSERVSNNHALSVYLSKLALKYAIEASYELNFIPKSTWVDTYLNLDIKTFTDNDCAVIKYDDAYTGDDNLDILDNLIILDPYYSSLYFNTSLPCRDSISIQQNYIYYEPKISPDYVGDGLNRFILTGLTATSMQTNTTNSNTNALFDFYMNLYNTLNTNTTGIWGYFTRNNTLSGNDISLSAAFIKMFLNNICGLRIQGGVTESKFYYEEFGIRGTYNSYMPPIWKNVKVNGVGPNSEMYNVVNCVFYSPE
jgi:trehalose/maltose hydrolase-like predicted phosphorylase